MSPIFVSLVSVSMFRQMLRGLALIAVASPVLAQDVAADWDATEDPQRKLIAASTTFSNGLSIALRCLDGRYDALIAGLPPAEGEETRSISMQFGDEEPRARDWYVTTNPAVVVSDLPARLARELRKGGTVKIRMIEPGTGRRLRFDLELPTSNAQIDRTLEACGRPTLDNRDEQIESLGANGLPPEIGWARAPRPDYPSGRTYTRGSAVVSCLSQSDGRLRDCVIESENPLDGGFGEAALAATARARLQNRADPDGPVPTRMIIYTTRFRTRTAMDPSPLGSRVPDRD